MLRYYLITLLAFAAITANAQGIQSFVTNVNQKKDSLESKRQIDQYNKQIDSLRLRLTSTMDSLTKLPNPDLVLVKSLDSLRGRLDSLKQSDLLKEARNISGKAGAVGKQINQKINSMTSRVNEKLQMLSPNTSIKGISIPGSPNLTLNDPLKSFTPSYKLPDAGASLSKQLPELDVNLSNTNITTPDVGIDNSSIQKATEVQKLTEIQNLSEVVESKLAGLDEVQSLQNGALPADQFAEVQKKWNSDPEFAKEILLNNAKEQAFNHFAGREAELKAAMDKLNKVKEKYKESEGIVDMLKKPENPMKGKAFIERLVPAVAFQLQFSSKQWIDLNPSIGYKISGRWTAGIGWMERFAFSVKERTFLKKDHAYGPRSFVDFKVKGSLLLKIEGECVNAIANFYQQGTIKPENRVWIWSYFGGLKKTFAIAKYMKGNIQLMYNLYDPEKRSPYMNRFNLRMGFEFPIVKKVPNDQ